MIKITWKRDANGCIRAFSVIGHAGAAPKGKDIVCAAVSALAQSAVLGLERHLRRKMRVIWREGCLEATIFNPPPDAMTDAVLETMLLGLREIAAQYPDFVKLEAAEFESLREPRR